MSCQNTIPAGSKFPQAMVDQRPVYDKAVFSKKSQVWRPTKKKKKVRFI